MGHVQACQDWIDYYVTPSQPKLGFSLMTVQCDRGNMEACAEKGERLLKQGERVEAERLFNASCEANVADGCVNLGDIYRSQSIITASQHYKKACSLSKERCWKTEFLCSEFDDGWRHFEKTGELEETLRICDQSCKEGSRYACWSIDRYRNERGESFEKKGDLVSAAAYFDVLCSQNRMYCSKRENVCSITQLKSFREKNPNEKERSDTLELCRGYCQAGNDAACGGLASFYQEDEDWKQAFHYWKAECDSNKEQCRSLDHYCTFYMEEAEVQGEDALREAEKSCEAYVKYTGERKNGRRDGQGELVTPIKHYKGQWKDDKPNGYGEMTYSNGSKYEGEWNNGKYHGKGKHTWAGGRTVQEGQFEHGKFVGKN